MTAYPDSKLAGSRINGAHTGNTMSEYGMIGVLALIVCIGGLSLLGGNINVVFGGVPSAMKAHSNNATAWQQVQVGQFTKAKAKAMSKAVEDALQNGASQSEAIQVTAANGDSLQGMFSSLARTLFPTPASAMSDAQIQEMERDMSNQAFAIAELERQMQDILNYAGDDPARFMKLTLSYKGNEVPAITLASGILSQVAKLTDMMGQLSGTNANADDKAKLQTLVTKISGDAAAIYSKSLALQSQYQAAVAKAQLEKANQALAEAASAADMETKAQKETEATKASQIAENVQEKSSASADAASNTAQQAKSTGSTPENAVTTAAATTTKSAGVMCETGNGKTLPSQCVPLQVTKAEAVGTDAP